MPYYLGIDGGGTKTTCVVGDDARILATAISGPSNIVRVGEAQTRASLLEAVQQVCRGAGISPTEISRTCVGGSGAARAELAAVIRKILSEMVSTPVDVVGDHQTTLAAAFGEGPGVIVIAGTGSIAYGRDHNGRTARAGGWGFAIGDEGSAHWIGRTTVNAILRAADVSGEDAGSHDKPSSPLVSALFEAWGVTSLLGLARAANAVPPPDFAALFPAVSASAVSESGDPLAAEVLTAAGRELARLAAAITPRLFPSSISTIAVATSGGVFRHSAQVREVFYNELRSREPRAAIHPEVVDPVEGALRLARRAAHQE
ncbi:MAG TPA: BadF/BadG/BcrA/BcrD ATPase family protein [Candidatus Solibacter sp.]|nr:BadF/BadG/BcrA/BcrD ATPase family protein [Candidatus Solibacter sp.]